MESKTKIIKQLTNDLIEKFGSTNIIVTDYWEGDNFAIGFSEKTKQFTVYVSHYNKPKGMFFVALEKPPVNRDELYSRADEYEEITQEEAQVIIAKHLRLNKFSEIKLTSQHNNRKQCK